MRHPHGLRAALAGSSAGIQFIASAQAQLTTNGSTLVINKPTNTQSGDLMIALCAVNGARTWTGDTGWTEVVDQGANPSVRIAYLVAGASEPASYTFTSSGSSFLSGVIVTFRNALYDTVGTISTTNASGVQTAPAITLSSSSSAILAFFAINSANCSWSSPTSGLISTATDSDTNAPSWALYRELNLASGSTGTRSATASTTTPSMAAVLVGIKPS